MAAASPADVRGVLDTSLDDSEIESFIDDAAFEAEQEITDYSSEFSAEDKSQLEKYLAALLIRSFKEKGVTSQSGPSRSASYEDTWSVSELRAKVDQRDPSGELASSVVTDTDRYIGSTA